MNDPSPAYLTTEEAAAYTSIPASTLITLRSRGGGPLFIKRGKTVRYAIIALDAWMQAQTQSTESSPS